MMGAFPNAAQYQLCSDSPNSLISLHRSGDTPVAMEVRKDPGSRTFTSLRYFTAVLSFFQNARCIIVGGSSPSSAGVSASPDLKECMVDVVRSAVLRSCTLSAFVISGADMGVFRRMGVLVFGRWEIFGKG